MSNGNRAREQGFVQVQVKMDASAPGAATTQTAADESLDLLERLLQGQLDGYRRILGAIERQRTAIRTADAAALDTATREEESIVRALTVLDAQRGQMLAHLHKKWMPQERRAATLSQILRSAPPDVADAQRRARLEALANHLRQAVETSKSRSAVVRSAAEMLSRHIAGIQQTVHSALSRARVYGRRGKLAMGAATPATVDVKS